MSTLPYNQMDAQCLISSLAFFILATVCHTIWKTGNRRLPWQWLALFGITAGTTTWLALITTNLGNNLFPPVLSTGTAILTLGFLTEFGRAGLAQTIDYLPGRWLYLPLALLFFGNQYYGWPEINLARIILTTFGLVGGLATTLTFILTAKPLPQASRLSLFSAGIALGLWAILGVTFTDITPPPLVYVIEVMLIIWTAIAIWYYDHTSLEADLTGSGLERSTRNAARAAVVLVMIITPGLLITQFVSDHSYTELIQKSREQTTALVNLINTEIDHLQQSAGILSRSPCLTATLTVPTPDNIAKANEALSRFNKTLATTACYLLDSKGYTIAASNWNEPVSFLGQDYSFRPYFQDAGRGRPVCYFAEGVTSHERGCYISYPLLDPQQTVIGVLVVKKDLAALETNFTQHPFCFLLDPHGVIFLAGRSDLRLKTLWPLTEEAKQKLLASRQFGNQPFSPLLSQAVSNEANIVLEGKPFVVTQQSIAQQDWSLVLLNSCQQLLTFRALSQSFILILCLLTITFFAIHELTRKSAVRLAASESQLRAANQKLENIIDFLPDPTFVIDQAKKVIAWNQAIEKLTGVPKEQMIGKGDFAYAVPFYGEPRPLLIDLLDSEAISDNLAYKYVTKRGNCIYGETFISALFGGKGTYLWGTASPLFDKDGNRLGAIESIRDITQRAELENQLKYLSYHDPLTGLFNRAYFEQEIERLQNGGKSFLPVGIIVADANGLKLINDTLGHEAGDSFLQAAAAIFQESFRRNDLVARIGGDEFAVVLPNSDPAILEVACQRVRQAINRHNAAHPELPMSFSLGAAYTNEADKSLHELCKEADDRMYREKIICREISRNTIVNGLIKALEARDYLTEGHTERLQAMATDLAARLGLAGSVVANLQLLAKFHDIGKVGIPEQIIFKSGPLTPEEALEMQRHCEIGYRIAQTIPDFEPVAELILKHHEQWDGQGYPAGLKGEAIPLECRILAMIHAYDTMTHDRPYRRALPHTTAIAEIQRYSGSKFDPELVPQFIALAEENKTKNR